MIDGWRELATSEPIRYGLGLAAAGLLPVKKEWAYRTLCIVLALLWASAAAELDVTTAWSNVATVEALILLVLGVSWPPPALPGRGSPLLTFPARNGAWTVAGTIAILYCLIAFPLLAGFHGDPQFYRSSLRFPFPLVLFTCAVLFFAVERTADFALALPLAWAFLGGPFFPSADRAELIALEVALLAGVLFIVRPPSLRGGSERRAAPGDEYRLATRHRARFARGLWVLVLLSLFLFFLAGYNLEPPSGRMLFHLALLSALGIALWLAFPAWHSSWFRYATWHAANAAGRAGSGIRRGWKWVLLPLLVVLLVASQIKPAPDSKPGGKAGKDAAAGVADGAGTGGSGTENSATGKPAAIDTDASEPEGWRGKLAAFFTAPFTDLRELLAGKSWFWVFLGAVLLWLLYRAYSGRKRLIIQEFANHTGETSYAELVKGLGTRLQTELARISDLYKIIDAAQPIQKGGGPIVVAAGVQDVGAILQEASEISIGSVKISGKFLSGLVAGLIRGPQLTGALHKVSGGYALTAQLSGGGRSASWRVDLDPLPSPETALAPGAPALAPGSEKAPAGEAALAELVEQLAFRVATEMVDIGSPRWKAVRCFTDGLRYYRDTQRRIENRDSDLRKAERCLIRALSDDRRFTQCHHNLGVVYRELKEFGSAEAAFRRALEEDPSRGETFYALAETYVQDEKHLEAGWFCKAAIGIDSADARAWDLWAFARRRQGGDGRSKTPPVEPDDAVGKEILEMRRIAVALAWRSLCREALRGDSVALSRLQDTARLSTFNLAVFLARRAGAGRAQADRAESVRLLRQAVLISPHNTNLRLHQGRALLWSGLPDAAAVALDGVFADGLDTVNRGLLWSSLALTRALSGSAAVRLVHRRFLDLASQAVPRDLQRLIDQSLETPPSEKGT